MSSTLQWSNTQPKLTCQDYGEKKLDGSALNTEMEKQKLLQKFKHKTNL